MTTRQAPRKMAIATVVPYAIRHWVRQPFLVSVVVVSIVVATVLELLAPVYAGRMIDAVAHGSDHADEAAHAFYAMVAIGLGAIASSRFAWSMVIPFTLRILGDVTRETIAHVQGLSVDWHANSFAGSTVRKVTRGMGALDQLTDIVLLNMLQAVVLFVGITGMFWVKSPWLGVVVFVGMATFVATSVTSMVAFVAPAARLANLWDSRLGGAMADTVGCISTVKSFGAEVRENSRIDKVVSKWRRRTRRMWWRYTMGGTFLAGVLFAMRTSVVGVSLLLWSKGQASVGTVTYVMTSYLVVHGFLREFGSQVDRLQRAANDLEDLVALNAEPFTVVDAPGAPDLKVAGGEIRFEGVSFHYGRHVSPLYEGLDLTIRAGERVGLVGRSGSGKSTFVRLVQRLYDVTGGRITIDGIDVASVRQESLRSQVALVPQDTILFHRSLGENIAYGRPGATMAEVENAARLAHADEFIARLPKGYATMVGERGVKLSGGERQRVALARAFLADAPILILDEATSSLDTIAERAIREASDELMQGRTAIVVAHRLSTVMALDRIVVFERGKVVEDGKHADLLCVSNGVYRRLFEGQHDGVLAEEPETV